MSIGHQNTRNICVLFALIVGTITATVVGVSWLHGQGTTLIEEFAYTAIVLVAGLYMYDRLLIM